MELLLNLVWLALALPAFWVLHRAPKPEQGRGRVRRTNSFVLLACVITLLFPVISVTDDLQVVRPEIEESGLQKRLVRPSASVKVPVASDSGAGAQLLSAVTYAPADKLCGIVLTHEVVAPRFDPASTVSCRAPPQRS